MTARVSADDIERIVGAPRHENLHLGRAITDEKTVYILHSQRCKDSTPDLRTCAYSVALDHGIEDLLADDAGPAGRWEDWQDRPIAVMVWRRRLHPMPRWVQDRLFPPVPGGES